MEWISVKDRLPEFDTPVMIILGGSFHSKNIWLMLRDNDYDGWLWSEHISGCINDKDNYEASDDYAVTHWMPLPEPPKEA